MTWSIFTDRYGLLDYTHVIAIGECSNGNERVGDMWLVAHRFPKEATAEEIIEWAYKNGVSGKIMLTIESAAREA